MAEGFMVRAMDGLWFVGILAANTLVALVMARGGAL